MKYEQSFGNKLYPEITSVPEKFDKVISDFIEYVRDMDNIAGDFELDFRKGILRAQEDYKERLQKDMQTALKWDAWEQFSIGSGSISGKFYNEIILREEDPEFNLIDRGFGRPSESSNLVKFKNKLCDSNDLNRVEKALFDIYRSKGEQAESDAFQCAVSVFGGKYDVISFLFFLKDPKRFLPAKPKKLKISFEMLGIDHKMAKQCRWDNYTRYLDIVKILKNQVLSHFNPEITLLDTHSFLWVIHQDHAPDRFRCWRERIPIPSEGTIWIEEDDFLPTVLSELQKPQDNLKRTKKGKKREERNNKEIGDAGEAFVFDREIEKMRREGIDKTPVWVARDEGDGYGYDIRSYEKKGDEVFEVYIEVKTTVRGMYAPFYVTANELNKSKEYGEAYRLYRVYNFGAAAGNVKIMVEKGSLEKFCKIPELYKVYLEA